MWLAGQNGNLYTILFILRPSLSRGFEIGWGKFVKSYHVLVGFWVQYSVISQRAYVGFGLYQSKSTASYLFASSFLPLPTHGKIKCNVINVICLVLWSPFDWHAELKIMSKSQNVIAEVKSINSFFIQSYNLFLFKSARANTRVVHFLQ